MSNGSWFSCFGGFYVLVGLVYIWLRWNYLRQIITRKYGSLFADKLKYTIPIYVIIWPFLIAEFISDCVKDWSYYKQVKAPCECGGILKTTFLEYRKSRATDKCAIKCDRCGMSVKAHLKSDVIE